MIQFRGKRARVGVIGLLAALSAACGGEQGVDGAASGAGASGPGAAGSGSNGGAAGVGPASCTGGVSVAATPLRRFTHTEYDHAVRALLGTALEPARDFPPDSPAGGFASNRGEAASQLGIEKLMLAAEALAVEAAPRLFAACGEAGEAACAHGIYSELARKAYRRALDATELAELDQLYLWGQTNGGAALGYEVVLERVLQSPHFFYHIERTGPVLPGTTVAPLTGASVADRLAAFVWHSLPDVALLDAAERGELDTAAGIAAQAERMLADAQGRDGVVAFFDEYLDIEKLANTEKGSTYPAYTPTVRTEMWNETASFVDFVLRQGDGKLETLLTSPLAMPSASLAPLYGLTPGQAFTPMDPLVRSGILTHPAVLAVHAHSDQSSPVRRGAFIRDRVLCTPLPDPPPNVNANPPVVTPGATTRQRFEQHRAEPSCSVCHSLIDPVGFAFERYDGMGLYRTMDGALPIDTTGMLTGTQDIDGAFQDGVELSKRFATSKQVRDCMATQWLRYAVRRVETAADGCSQAQISAGFRESGDMKELVRAVVQSDAFRYKNKGTP
jgi:hypothetical protein